MSNLRLRNRSGASIYFYTMKEELLISLTAPDPVYPGCESLFSAAAPGGPAALSGG